MSRTGAEVYAGGRSRNAAAGARKRKTVANAKDQMQECRSGVHVHVRNQSRMQVEHKLKTHKEPERKHETLQGLGPSVRCESAGNL